MAYNTDTEGALLAKRLTARQALPRNLTVTPPRNLFAVRHASPPSNDAGLHYEEADLPDFTPETPIEELRERLEQIAEAAKDAPPPAITSPTSGETLTDPLYPIVGTAFPLSEVSLYYEGSTEPVSTTRADQDGNFSFDGDTPAAEGQHTWHVSAAGKTSEAVTVTLTIPPPVITSPTDGETLTDPLYPIIGTATPLSDVELYYEGSTDPVANTQADPDGNFAFDGDTPAAEGQHTWHVVADGKTSATVTVTLTITPEQLSFKTHAEADQYLVDHSITAPDNWGNMLLADKSVWVNGYLTEN